LQDFSFFPLVCVRMPSCVTTSFKQWIVAEAALTRALDAEIAGPSLVQAAPAPTP
jgi:hypothetical protein